MSRLQGSALSTDRRHPAVRVATGVLYRARMLGNVELPDSDAGDLPAVQASSVLHRLEVLLVRPPARQRGAGPVRGPASQPGSAHVDAGPTPSSQGSGELTAISQYPPTRSLQTDLQGTHGLGRELTGRTGARPSAAPTHPIARGRPMPRHPGGSSERTSRSSLRRASAKGTRRREADVASSGDRRLLRRAGGGREPPEPDYRIHSR